MVRLSKALRAWGTSAFEEILKDDIQRLDAGVLPLQQGLSRGSHSNGEGFSVMIIGISDEPNIIRVKSGIFYASIVAGCSCADDPTPIDELAEYCEVQFDIDKITAETKITLLS